MTQKILIYLKNNVFEIYTYLTYNNNNNNNISDFKNIKYAIKTFYKCFYFKAQFKT